MNNDLLKTKTQLIAELESLRKKSKEKEDELIASNQQLLASEQQLRATNQQLAANEQQLRASNQQLEATNQQLRTSEKEAKLQRDLLLEAQKIAHISHWAFDPATNTPWWPDELYKIYGLAPSNGPLSYEEHSKLVHPDDWEWFDATVKETFETGKPYDIILRILRPNGEVRYINLICKTVLDATGAVIEMHGTVQDVTEQKLAEQNLKQSEEKFRGVFEDSNVGITIGTAQGDVIEVNDEYLKITGYSREEFVIKNFAEITHPDDLEKELPLYEQLLKGEIDNYRIVKRLKAKRGGYVWLDSAITVQKDERGKIEKTLAFVVDVTEGKKATETVNAFFDIPMNLHLICSIEGEIVKVNKGWEETMGYTKEESIGKNIFDFVHPDDKASTLNELSDLQSGKTTFNFENRYLHKNGNYITLAWSAIFSTTGKMMYGFAKDITQRKAYQEQLMQSEERYKALSENAKHIILTHNFDGEITYINQFGLDFINIPKEQLVGANIKSLIQDEAELEKMQQRIKDFLSGSVKVHQFELNFALPSGDEKTLEVIGNPILQNGNIDSFLLTAYDITESKKTERKILEQNEEYEALNEELRQTNDELFTTISRNDQINDLFHKAIAATSDGLWDWNLITNEIYFSPRWKAILGYKDDELPNDFSIWEQLTKPEDVKRSWDILHGLIKGTENKFDVEFKMKHKKGHWVDIHSRANLFRNDEGKAIRFVGTHTDITKRKQAEEALKESEEKFRALYNNAPLSYQSLNDDGSFKDVNPTWLSTLGYERDEVIGKFYKDFLHPSWKPHFEKNFPAFKKRGYVNDVQFKIRHKKGHFLDISFEGCVGYNPDGSFKQTYCVFQDISERKKAETKLRESEEKLKNIIENSTNLFYSHSVDNEVTFISPQVTTILGYEPHEAMKPWTEFITDNPINKKAEEFTEKAIKTGRRQPTYEMEIQRKDGRKIMVEVREAPVVEDGKVVSIVGSLTDITERKQSEKTNKELLKRFELIGLHLPGVIYQFRRRSDGSFHFPYASHAIISIYGVTPEEVEHDASNAFKAIHPDDLERVSKSISLSAETLNAWHDVYRINKPSGKIIWVEGSSTPMKMEDGSIIWHGFIQDITERKLAEENIKSISRRLQLSTESANIGIWELDLKQNTLNWDKRMFELYGITPDNFGGAYEAWQKGVHPDDIDKTHAEVQDAIAGKKDFHTQFRVVWPNGHIRHIEAHALVTHDQDGNPKKMIGVNWDITAIKNTEINLTKAKEKAEESDRLKSAFLSNMSHEIRTPMNGILGFTSLLKQPFLTGDKRDKYIQIIEKSGIRMLNTINDIVDISKIEAGQVEVSKKELSLNKLLREQFNFFAPETEAKGVELIYQSIISDSDSRIISDKHKLEGILTNLIKNAIKFTESGSITFGYTIKGIEGKEMCEFYVKDTGIGIPTNRIDAIFNRFEQADIEDKRVFEGSGLGLAISKSYVEMLGGTISVSTEVGVGSTFTFNIPYIQQNQNPRSSKRTNEDGLRTSLKNLSIIVAEDDEFSKMLLETILENEFDKITYTSTGRETIDKCKEIPNTDIILMDIKMPGINGFTATELIRKFNKDVIIIAQTAYGLIGDKEKALEVGCDEYIAKPIKKERLLEKIQLCLNKKYN